MVKKVVVTEGKFKDYSDEIQQSYELGCTPERLHKNADGTFVTPFVFMMVRYMFRTMLPRGRLVIEILKRMK